MTRHFHQRKTIDSEIDQLIDPIDNMHDNVRES